MRGLKMYINCKMIDGTEYELNNLCKEAFIVIEYETCTGDKITFFKGEVKSINLSNVKSVWEHPNNNIGERNSYKFTVEI